MSGKKKKFIVLGLPRSRTKWLSEFLSYGRHRCGHDIVVGCDSISQFEKALRPLRGTVETGAVMGWKLLKESHPEAQFVALHRPLAEIFLSFERLGIGVSPEQLYARYEMLEAFSSSPGVINIQSADLGSWVVAEQLFDILLDEPLDVEWFQEMRDKNIQIDMGKRLEELALNQRGLESLTSEVLSRSSQLGSESCLALN